MENKREIKFRAWYKDKMYTYVELVTFEDGSWSVSGLFPNVNNRVFAPNNESGKEPILMQFTGYHDKEGVEVYDQDICKSVHFKEGKKTHYLYHKIVWCNKLLCWKAVSVQNGEDESTLTSGNSQLWVYIKNAGEFEVVGSTLTHPHLLEKQ